MVLCKALWITTVYEMCYINKCLALPKSELFNIVNATRWTLFIWTFLHLFAEEGKHTHTCAHKEQMYTYAYAHTN